MLAIARGEGRSDPSDSSLDPNKRTAVAAWTTQAHLATEVVISYTPRREARSLLSLAVQKLPDETAMAGARERWREHLTAVAACAEP